MNAPLKTAMLNPLFMQMLEPKYMKFSKTVAMPTRLVGTLPLASSFARLPEINLMQQDYQPTVWTVQSSYTEAVCESFMLHHFRL